MNSARLKAYIYLLIVALIWGIAGPVIKLTLKEVPPFIFLAYRFLISSAIAIPYLIITRFKLARNLKTNLKLFAYCFLNTTGSLGLLFLGASKTSLLQMSLITIFGPILTILAGYLILKDHITKQEKIGIVITFIGSLLILLEPIFKQNLVSGNFWGNIFVFGYVLFATISSVLLKEILKNNVNPAGLTNLSFIIGFITTVPIALYLYTPIYILHTIYALPLSYHAGVWYLAVLTGTVGYMLLNIAQKSIEISELAVAMYLYPVISAFFAVIILGDRFTTLTLIGGVITAVGIVIAELKKRRYN